MSILMFGEPGTEIMYPDPGFPIYRSMIEFTGATPVPIPIREGYGFAFSAEETLSLITPRTRLIILNGWSKTYAMTGWRLGYAVWPGKLYDNARKLAVNFHSCVNAPTQYAGLAALKGPQDEVHKMVAEFDKRRKVVVEGLNKLPGVSCATPKGVFYAFPNIKRTGWKAK